MTVTYYYWLFVQPSHDLQTHLTNVFISWPADAFNSVCVLPSLDLQTLFTVFVSIHLMTSDTFDNVCVHLSHDLQPHLTVCLSISWPAHFWQFVFIHLMTCTLLTFDSVCVHPSYDLQTLLTIFVSIHLMTCRHFWQWFYVHPSHDIQTLFKVGFTVTW